MCNGANFDDQPNAKVTALVLTLTPAKSVQNCQINLLHFAWKIQQMDDIGSLASDFQRNQAVSMDYFPSNTSFSFSDNVASEKGFWIKS
jgi:hypothetical protein